jgi:hypothetical protein
MKQAIFTIAIFMLLMVSSPAFANGIIGKHSLANDRGLVRVKSVVGNKMVFDFIIYAPVKGNLVILTDVFADYNPKTQQAVYSEEKSCPDALKFTFQRDGRVILREAACSVF